MVPEAAASCSLQMWSWPLKMSFPTATAPQPNVSPRDARQSAGALRSPARHPALQLRPSVTFSRGRAAEGQRGATCAAPPRATGHAVSKSDELAFCHWTAAKRLTGKPRKCWRWEARAPGFRHSFA